MIAMGLPARMRRGDGTMPISTASRRRKVVRFFAPQSLTVVTPE